MGKQSKTIAWDIVGYYFDGKHSWTLYENESGQTKRVKEKSDATRKG